MTKIPTLAEAAAALDAAKETLAGLQKKQADHTGRVDVIRQEKEGIAFEAHSKGGKAKDQLAVLNLEMVQLELTAADLASAVKRASANVTFSEALLEAAAGYEAADSIEAAAQEAERLGAGLQRCLDEFANLWPQFKHAVIVSGAYGYPFVEATRRAYNAAGHRLNLTDPQPFAYRTTFAELAKAYGHQVREIARRKRARLIGLIGRKEAA